MGILSRCATIFNGSYYRYPNGPMKDKPNDVTDPDVERKGFKDLQKLLHLAVKLELFYHPVLLLYFLFT